MVVVLHDYLIVGRQMHVKLDTVESRIQAELKSRQGVLRIQASSALAGNDSGEDVLAPLSCNDSC
jgi:hypothetical protein